VASGHVSAYFAAGQGKVRNDSHVDDEDDDSVVTDHTSDQEITVQDDQSRIHWVARDISNLTTYRGDRNSSSENTKSPPANVLSGGYKFNVGSTVNIFWKVHGHGGWGFRQPLWSIQGISQHRVLTRPNDNWRTTASVNAVGQRAS
jgi:hypothetical protein